MALPNLAAPAPGWRAKGDAIVETLMSRNGMAEAPASPRLGRDGNLASDCSAQARWGVDGSPLVSAHGVVTVDFSRGESAHERAIGAPSWQHRGSSGLEAPRYVFLIRRGGLCILTSSDRTVHVPRKTR